ncbi:hypothetical protein [Microvirga brassicacearum]|uniref:Uncharacterized protein n=1 Tax=Microvirga brassicacearum TaxID=2580413 RepID=A0A5N3P517_9HYPH|nr:hypothetical protein [Microvirga brassicacearum]KAB0264830.1 hypothetical protein FEZ63_21060 [Microvirga brassicacearum]
MTLKTSALLLIAASLLPIGPAAATPLEDKCQALTAATKQAEANSIAFLAVYKADKTEPKRCEYLKASVAHFRMLKKTFETCRSFHPKMADEMVATANEVLRETAAKSGCKNLR